MPDTSDSWKSSDRIFQIIVLAAVLLVGALLGAAGWALITAQKSDASNVVILPLLAIGGLLALLIVLGLVAVLLETIGLANKDQALALPEGSVRAVIALGLIVLFAILAIYLYASISKSPPPEAVSVDFAKQLLTIMGTLVTAVASFYFGANTVASAHKAAAKQAQKNGDQEEPGGAGEAPGGSGAVPGGPAVPGGDAQAR
jgi:hypothetical protein